MPEDRFIRAFIAINLPETVRATLARLESDLESALPGGGVRWARPEQIHLTLKFLGDIAADSVEDLKVAVRRACQGVAPIWLHAEGLGVFPGERKPRVIWVGLCGDPDGVRRLQQQIENETGGWRAREERPFHPHLTLARVKHLDAKQGRILEGKMTALKSADWGAWQAGHIELVQSRLTAAGAEYFSLADFPLAGRGGNPPS